MQAIGPVERRGLICAGLSALVVVLGILFAAGPSIPGAGLLDGLPGWGVLRNPDPAATGPEAFRRCCGASSR